MMTRFVERYLVPVWLLACLGLGGAAGAGYVANAALQIAAAALVAWLVSSGRIPPLPRRAKGLLLLVAAAAVLMLLQLVPMPAALWSRLPERAEVAHAFALAGAGSPWLPLSLAPDRTVAALLSLLPPFATILVLFASSRQGRLHAIYALVLFAVVSILLGFEQKVGGVSSPLYLYEVTNRGSPVGFFANRNHLATLLLATIPFASMLAIARDGDRGSTSRAGRRLVAGCIIALVVLGIVYVASDAGWALLLPALLAGGAIFARGDRGRMSRRLAVMAGAAAVVAIGLAPVVIRDTARKLDAGTQQRTTIVATTLAAARDYLPVGSGGGSFGVIYPSYEDPEAATDEYINHAHCDYAEVALEYGVPGIALLVAAFALWLGGAAATWRSVGVDGDLARAGFVAVGLIAAHSLVDYPVRTTAIAALLAMACALQAAPATEASVGSRIHRRSRKPGGRAMMIDLSRDIAGAGTDGRAPPPLG